MKGGRGNEKAARLGEGLTGDGVFGGGVEVLVREIGSVSPVRPLTRPNRMTISPGPALDAELAEASADAAGSSSTSSRTASVRRAATAEMRPVRL